MRKFDIFRRNRNEHDKLLSKASLYIFFVAAALILFEKVIGHLPAISTSISTGFSYFNHLVSPFIMGFAIAYVMNPFMMFFERKFLKWFEFCRKHKKLTRTFCILLMYTIVIGGTVWIVIYLLPEIRDSIMAFATNISVYSEAMNERIRYIFDQIPYIDSEDVNNVINRMLAPIKDISENAPELIETIATNVYSFGRITLNFVMAIFIAFYMLYDKERFGQKIRKGAYALSNE
ncbi:MAG: AI-2E family transporter, partial [Anaerotignum sp.]|nr:AI-2E family transporter [Anaerotignum sp.]